jgi:hypothetical protein
MHNCASTDALAGRGQAPARRSSAVGEQAGTLTIWSVVGCGRPGRARAPDAGHDKIATQMSLSRQ